MKPCRVETGPRLVLPGGVPPNLWLPYADVAGFDQAVLRWLDLRRKNSRLVVNAGDQVPQGAPEDRIHRMRDLVERQGQY